MLSKVLPSQLKAGAFVLMTIMAATRIHHFGDTFTLPDASLAVFFLSGWWFGGLTLFIALLLEAGLLDYVAISQFGVSDYCISPAYVFLIPTYAVLWYGGRFCKTLSESKTSHFAAQFGILLISVSIAFLISNGSFYLLSGKYPNNDWAEYLNRFMMYYPPYLKYAVIYTVTIYGLTRLFKHMRATSPQEKQLPKI